MKFSVCCITQTRHSSWVVALLLLLTSVFSKAQSGASPELIRQWNQTADKNDLIAKGRLPFHLKMQFVVHDLQGHPGNQGTLEEWWAGEQGFRLEINSSLEHVVGPGRKDLLTDEARRENYLVMGLLHEVVAPMAHLAPELPYNIFREKRNVNGVALSCYQYANVSVEAPNPKGSFVCVNEETGSIRQVPYADEVAARNNMGKFREQVVALDTEIAYDDVKAIEGHVTELKSFDPTQSSVALVNPEAKRAAPRTVIDHQAENQLGPSSDQPSLTVDAAKGDARAQPGTVAAGIDAGSVSSVFLSPESAEKRLIKSAQPTYPEAAKHARLGGMVLLYVTISPAGVVESSFPIVSANQVLTLAAQDCAKKWIYKPYEMNGSPTQVNTTLTFHFHMNSSSGLR